MERNSHGTGTGPSARADSSSDGTTRDVKLSPARPEPSPNLGGDLDSVPDGIEPSATAKCSECKTCLEACSEDAAADVGHQLVDFGCSPEFPFPSVAVSKRQLLPFLIALKSKSSQKTWLQNLITECSNSPECDCGQSQMVLANDPPLVSYCHCPGALGEANKRQRTSSTTASAVTLHSSRKSRLPATHQVSTEVQTSASLLNWFDDFVRLPIYEQLQLILMSTKQLLIQKHCFSGTRSVEGSNTYSWLFDQIRYISMSEQQLNAHLAGRPNCAVSDQTKAEYYAKFTMPHLDALAALSQYVPNILLESLSCLARCRSGGAPSMRVLYTDEVTVSYWTEQHTYEMLCYKSDEYNVKFYSIRDEEFRKVDAWERSFLRVPLRRATSDTTTVLATEWTKGRQILGPPWLRWLRDYHRTIARLESALESVGSKFSAAPDPIEPLRSASALSFNLELVKLLNQALAYYLQVESEIRPYCLLLDSRSEPFLKTIVLTATDLQCLTETCPEVWAEKVLELVSTQLKLDFRTTGVCVALAQREAGMKMSRQLSQQIAKGDWLGQGRDMNSQRPGVPLSTDNRAPILQKDARKAQTFSRCATKSNRIKQPFSEVFQRSASGLSSGPSRPRRPSFRFPYEEFLYASSLFPPRSSSIPSSALHSKSSSVLGYTSSRSRPFTKKRGFRRKHYLINASTLSGSRSSAGGQSFRCCEKTSRCVDLQCVPGRTPLQWEDPGAADDLVSLYPPSTRTKGPSRSDRRRQTNTSALPGDVSENQDKDADSSGQPNRTWMEEELDGVGFVACSSGDRLSSIDRWSSCYMALDVRASFIDTPEALEFSVLWERSADDAREPARSESDDGGAGGTMPATGHVNKGRPNAEEEEDRSTDSPSGGSVPGHSGACVRTPSQTECHQETTVPASDHGPAVCASCPSVVGVDVCQAAVDSCGGEVAVRQLCPVCQPAQQGSQSCRPSTEPAPGPGIKMASDKDGNGSQLVPEGRQPPATTHPDVNSDANPAKSKTTASKRLCDEPLSDDGSSIKVQKLAGDGDEVDRPILSCDLLSSLIRPPLHQWSSTEGRQQKDSASVVEGKTESQTRSAMSSQAESGDAGLSNEEASSLAVQHSTENEERAESRTPSSEPSTGVCLSQETNGEAVAPAHVNQGLSMDSSQINQQALHSSPRTSYPNGEPIHKGQHSFCTDREPHCMDEESLHVDEELGYACEESLHPAQEPLHPGQRSLRPDEELLCTNREPRCTDGNIPPSSRTLPTDEECGRVHEGVAPISNSDKGDTRVNHSSQVELCSKKAGSSPEDLEPGISSRESDHAKVDHGASCTQLGDGSAELDQPPAQPATEGSEATNVEPGDRQVDAKADTGHREACFEGDDAGAVASDVDWREDGRRQAGGERGSAMEEGVEPSYGQPAPDSRPVDPGRVAGPDGRPARTEGDHGGRRVETDGTPSERRADVEQETHDGGRPEREDAHAEGSPARRTEARMEERMPSPASSPELYLPDPASQSPLSSSHCPVLHDSQETLGLLQDSDLYMNDSFTSRVSDDTDEDSDLPIIQLSCDVRSPKQSNHLSPAQHSPQQTQDEEMRTREFCALSRSSPATVLPPGGTDEQMVELRQMLDKMLTEKQAKLDDKQLAAQINEINEDLRKGGINKFSIDEVEETELLPEHKAKLKQFEIQNSLISGEAPGINLFHMERARSLFTYPQTLTLSACGFTPGRSSLDKMLSTSDPDCICELLNSSLIQMSFDSLSCPEAFMDWLFFVLSDLEDDLLAHGSLILLLDLLQREHGKGHQWIPTTLTLARVFVNYGASLQGLLPVMDLVDFTDADLSLTNNKENSQPHSTPTPSQVLPSGRHWAFHEGLRHVLRVTAEAIHKRPHLYSVKDLLAITVMLLRVSIDKKLNNYCLMHDLKLCISAIFNAVPSDKWKSYIFDLCKLAPDLASHHHNLLQLVEVLPPSERGITVQHHLSYVFLRYLCFEDRETDFMDVKMRDLVPIIRSFKVKEDTDFYKLYSLCVLLDRCICKRKLPASEKADLKLLYDMLKSLMGSVRECITDLDRSVVKEMLSQLIIILHIKLESMGFKQCTMYQYHQQTATLQQQQQQPLAENRSESNQSEDSEGEASQSEAGLNGLHC